MNRPFFATIDMIATQLPASEYNKVREVIDYALGLEVEIEQLKGEVRMLENDLAWEQTKCPIG